MVVKSLFHLRARQLRRVLLSTTSLQHYCFLHLFGLMVENKKIMMRIADVLNTNDDEDDDFIGVKEKKNHRRRRVVEGCNSIAIRSILSRWISPFKRSKDLIKKNQQMSNSEEDCFRGIESSNGSFLLEDSYEGNDDDDDRSMEKSEESNSHTEIVHTPVSPLGSYMKDASFSLGVGAGLVYLMVSARNEFRKMTELRSQIESLIEDVGDGVRKKNINYGNKPLESNSVLGFSTTASPAVENVTIIQNCVSSHNLVISRVDGKYDEHLECLKSKDECVVGIDEFEAEFEAELERLQLSLDNEDSLDHSRQQEQEMVYVNSAPVRSDSSSFGIKDDPGELDTEEQSGVPPHELERRLHELVEARQQERIKELESALEHVKHELHEKEMEVFKWKDTARRFSPHFSEATPLSR